jgi:hypothetical protein
MKPENLPTYNAILYLSQNMINIKAKKIINADKNQYSPTTNNISNNNLTNAKQRSNENCLTHAMPNSLWCLKCNILVCRACASTEDHRNHTVKSLNEAKETIHNDVLSELIKMQKKLTDLQHLVFKQRDFLLKILEGCTTLKTQIETELINHIPTLEISDIRGNLSKAKLTLTLLEHQPSPVEAYRLFTSLNIEKQRLHYKYNEMLLQCKLEEIVHQNGSLLDFELLKQISAALNLSGIGGEALSLNIENQAIMNAVNNNNITSILTNPTVIANNNNNNTINNNNITLKNNNNHNSSTQPTTPISSASANHNGNLNHNSSSNSASPFNCNHILANLGHNNMILLLANYCISQLYSHHVLTAKTMAQALTSSSQISKSSTSLTSSSSANNMNINNNSNNNNHIGSINNNSNSILLGSLGCMIPDTQMAQLSMHDHILHKFSSIDAQSSNFLSTDLLGNGNIGAHMGNGSISNFITANNHRQIHHTPPPLNFMSDINGMVLQHHSLHSNVSNANNINNNNNNNNSHLTTSATSTNPLALTNSQPTVASIVQNPSVHVYPIYYFNIEINGSPFGRILIEVRNDVAPKMAKNFGSLCTGELFHLILSYLIK